MHRIAHHVLLPALAMAGPAPFAPALPAQATESRDAPDCAFDTAAFTRSHAFSIGLAAAGPNLTPVSGPDAVLWIADAIRSFFRPPDVLSLPLWARVTRSGQPVAGIDTLSAAAAVGHGLDDFIVLRLTREGRLADRNVAINTASPEFNASLLRAILLADSAGALPAPSDSLRRAGGRVLLRLVDYDSAHVPAVPLLRVSVSEIRADSSVAIISAPRIDFPLNARVAGIADTLTFQYVVTEEGRYLPGSVRAIRARYLEFIEAVEEALAKARFRPARVGACPVPSFVQQSFVFAFRR